MTSSQVPGLMSSPQQRPQNLGSPGLHSTSSKLFGSAHFPHSVQRLWPLRTPSTASASSWSLGMYPRDPDEIASAHIDNRHAIQRTMNKYVVVRVVLPDDGFLAEGTAWQLLAGERSLNEVGLVLVVHITKGDSATYFSNSSSLLTSGNAIDGRKLPSPSPILLCLVRV